MLTWHFEVWVRSFKEVDVSIVELDAVPRQLCRYVCSEVLLDVIHKEKSILRSQKRTSERL